MLLSYPLLMCLMRARRFLRPRLVRRRTPARRGVCLYSTAAVLLRRADSVLGETRGRSASPARAAGASAALLLATALPAELGKAHGWMAQPWRS